MTPTTPQCPHSDDLIELAALRLVPDDASPELAERLATCAACRERLAEYRHLAGLMPLLAPAGGTMDRAAAPSNAGPTPTNSSARTFQGELGDAAASTVADRGGALSGVMPATMPKSPRGWRGTAAVVAAALVVTLFAHFLSAGPRNANTRLSATAAPPTTTPVTTPQPITQGPATLYDVALARNVTYAFVQNSEVWVSIEGAQPRQLTHL